MAFFSLDKGLSKKDDGYGRLYVFRFELDSGETVWKVGMCNSDRSTDRFMEVCLGFFKNYRYVPRSCIRKDKKVVAPRLVEKHLHALLDEYRFSFNKKFSGSTEFFSDIDEKVLLDYLDNFSYNELLRGQDSMKTEDYDAIVAEVRKERDKLRSSNEGTDELPF